MRSFTIALLGILLGCAAKHIPIPDPTIIQLAAADSEAAQEGLPDPFVRILEDFYVEDPNKYFAKVYVDSTHLYEVH